MRVTPFLLTSLLAGLGPGMAAAQELTVDHPGLACVVAQRFPALAARIDPAGRVAAARAYFRADGGRHWYYVEMTGQDGVYSAALPRPAKRTKRIEYYIEAVDTASTSFRTPDHRPTVAGSAAECSRATAVAGAGGLPTMVVVHAAPGAPALPAGFETSGLAAAGSSGAAAAAAGGAAAGAAVAGTAAAAGAGGGGIGTAALVAGGVVVAGGAAAAATLGGGDGDGDGGDDDGDGSCGTARITDRTATTLTVTWSGGQPTDGVYVVDAGTFPAGTDCPVVHEGRQFIVRATSVVVTGLRPATTYAVHVHPAGAPCPTCETGYQIVDMVGVAIGATLGQ
jgi:hypothetical protein